MTVAVQRRTPTAHGQVVLASFLTILLLPGMLTASAATKPKPLVAGNQCKQNGKITKGARGVRLRCTKHGHTFRWVSAPLLRKHAPLPKKSAAPAKPAPSPEQSAIPSTAPMPTSIPSPSESTATQVPDVASFIVSMPFELSQVARISKFRSCSGHDYSSMNTDGIQETNRSMKHYVTPVAGLIGTTNQVVVYAPLDGIVTTIGTSTSYGDVGTDIWLNPDSNKSWALILFHITPAVKIGESVKAGQVIGYANLSNATVNAFDIALERFANPDGSVMTFEQAHQKYGDYSQMLHRGELDSIFNHMSSDVLANFTNKGFAVQKMMISQSDRDSAPCTFGGMDNPADWVTAIG